MDPVLITVIILSVFYVAGVLAYLWLINNHTNMFIREIDKRLDALEKTDLGLFEQRFKNNP